MLTWVSLIWIGGSAGLDGWVKTSVIYTSSAFLLLHQHSRRDPAGEVNRINEIVMRAQAGRERKDEPEDDGNDEPPASEDALGGGWEAMAAEDNEGTLALDATVCPPDV